MSKTSADPTERRAIELAQAQLDAYNARDIDAFMACYTKDVEIRDQHTGELIDAGHEAVRAGYTRLFAAAPHLHCQLVKRVACGRWVVDEELLTGHPRGNGVRAVAIYETVPGGIRKVWFLKP